MSFKDLTTRAAALLKSKPAETLKKEPELKASAVGPKKPELEAHKS